MTLSVGVLDVWTSGVGTTSTSPNTVNPSDNAHLDAYVTVRNSVLASPTFTGYGLTWTLQESLSFDGGDREYHFITNSGTGHSSGTASFDCTGDSADNVSVLIYQTTDSGGSAPTFVQSKSAQTVASSTPAATFNSAPASTSVILAFYGSDSTAAVTEPSGFTETNEAGGGADWYEASYLVGSGPTTVTWGNAHVNWGVIIVEIAAPSGGGGLSTSPLNAAWFNFVERGQKWWHFWQDAVTAATGNVTITPTAGALTLTGSSVGLRTTITPTAGALTLAGQTVGLRTSVAPVAGAVTLAGQTNGLRTTIGTVAGALTLAGQTVGLRTTIAPSAGALTLSGATDITLQVTGGVTITVTTPGAVTLTGQAVGIRVSVAPSPGAITLAGSSAGLRIALNASSGAITLAGQVIGLRTTVSPAAGALTLTGATDITLQTTGSTVVNVSTPGQLTLAGSILGLRNTVGVAAGALTLAGGSVLPTRVVTPTPGALTLAGQAQGLKTLLSVGSGSIMLAGQDVVLTGPGTEAGVGGSSVFGDERFNQRPPAELRDNHRGVATLRPNRRVR